MSLVRFAANLVLLVVYVLWEIIYQIARLGSSKSVIGLLIVFLVLWTGYGHEINRPIVIVIGLMAFGLLIHKLVKPPPKRPRFLRAPARPVPPPRAVATSGRADDPDEATVVGRLDPKLRDLLRRKPDAASS